MLADDAITLARAVEDADLAEIAARDVRINQLEQRVAHLTTTLDTERRARQAAEQRCQQLCGGGAYL